MPKIVVMDKEVIKGVTIRNFMTGGKEVVDKVLWEGTPLKDFPYFDPVGKKINVVDARLMKVNMSGSSSSTGSSSKPSGSGGKNTLISSPAPSGGSHYSGPEDPDKFSVLSMLKVDSIELDASKEMNSNVITVPQSCILEYAHGKVADDAVALPIVKLRLNVLLSDNHTQSIEVEEGDVFQALIYRTTPAPKVVIGKFTVKGFVFDSSYDVTGLVLDDGTNVTSVKLEDIKYFGTEANVVKDLGSIKDVFAGTKQNGSGPNFIELGEPGEIKDNLSMYNLCSVTGVQAGVPANTGDRANDEIDPETENAFAGNILTHENSDITFDGVALTDAGRLVLGLSKSVTFKNSKVVGINPSKTWVNTIFPTGNYTYFGDFSEKNGGTKWSDCKDHDIFVDFEGNYFGTPNKAEDSKNDIINVIAPIYPWTDGSTVSNNEFTDCCTNYAINIYQPKDGATITVENNHIKDAEKFCRIITAGTPKDVTINFNNNLYDTYTHNSNDTAKGLINIKVTKDTEDLSGLTINITGSKLESNYAKYIYALELNDSKETPVKFDKSKYPKIYINGKLETDVHVIPEAVAKVKAEATEPAAEEPAAE